MFHLASIGDFYSSMYFFDVSDIHVRVSFSFRVTSKEDTGRSMRTIRKKWWPSIQNTPQIFVSKFCLKIL